MRRFLLGVLAAALLAPVAACAAAVQPSASGPTGPACLERVQSSAPVAGGGTTGKAPALPAMALPCFAGGRYTDLAALGDRPTVINLWASWCTPCKQELPALQTFAADGAGRVRVVGVVTKDRHDQAQSVIEDKQLTFPMLEDPGQQFAIAASPLVSKGLTALPATLFVAEGGRIAYAYQGEPLTEARLKELSRQYLGVTV